eukprot:747437-Hanusia_phi.AAC.3
MISITALCLNSKSSSPSSLPVELACANRRRCKLGCNEVRPCVRCIRAGLGWHKKGMDIKSCESDKSPEPEEVRRGRCALRLEGRSSGPRVTFQELL